MQQEFRLDPFELPPPVGTTIDPCVPTMDAGASASGRPFDREAAAACMTFIASEIHSCFTLEGPEGMGRITVVFEPSGNVMTSSVEAWPFAGTPTGRCVERKFRMAHVPPFEGDAVTIHKVFVLGPPKPPSPRADRDSGLWR